MTKVVRRGLHTYGYLLIIATIITVFAALTTIGVSAVEFDRSYISYDINHDGNISENEKGVKITGFNGLNGGETVTIPAEIGGKPVLAIGLDGVPTTTSVPGAEYIGKLDLTKATNLKVILPYAFYWCSRLNGEIESNTVEEIGKYAFSDSIDITSFSAPALKRLGEDAFANHMVNRVSKLTSFNASALTTVGEFAFASCDYLTSFSAPKLTSVEFRTFSNCKKLTSLELPELKTVGGYAFYNCTELTSLELPELKTVGGYAFQGCTGLTSLELPELTTVGYCAFCSCTRLTSLELPELTTVEGRAFQGCTGLTSLELPELTTVENCAFKYCEGLTSLSAPKVTTVGDWAFEGCTGLTSITLKEGCSINFYTSFKYVPDDCTITYVNDNRDVVQTVKLSKYQSKG